MDVMGDSQAFDIVRIVQSKTGKAIAGFVTALTRKHILDYITISGKCAIDYLFTSKRAGSVGHITTQQYRKILKKWFDKAGMDAQLYSTHSLRRSKVSHIETFARTARTASLFSCECFFGVELKKHSVFTQYWAIWAGLLAYFHFLGTTCLSNRQPSFNIMRHTHQFKTSPVAAQSHVARLGQAIM